MNRLKRSLFSICLILAMVMGMTTAVSAAEDLSVGTAKNSYLASGSCGSGVSYSFDSSSGVLTISGSGKMKDYHKEGDAPWYTQRLHVKSIVVRPGVTYLGDYSFKYCQAVNAVIPASVKSIGTKAFIYTDKLGRIYYTGTKKNFKSIKIARGNSKFKSADVSYVSSMTQALTKVSSASSASSGKITATLNGSVLTIHGKGSMKDFIADMSGRPEWVKYRIKTKSVVISSGITSIGNYAFSDFTNLVSISIPFSVSRIGYRAFYKCYSLKNLTIPNSVTVIGQNAFQNCTGLTTVTMSNSVTEITAYCFNQCSKLTSLTLSSYTGKIKNCAFEGCKALKTVHYKGSSASYRNLSISRGNARFKKAKVSFT